MRGYRTPNKIGVTEGTRGTETSKYPEEKKETSIPQVAASERGEAQTEPKGEGLWAAEKGTLTLQSNRPGQVGRRG